MKWKIFQSKIKLDESQTEEIKDCLNSYRDQYTEICLLKSQESRKSPLGYAAELKTDFPDMEDDVFSEKFISFLEKERIPVSNLSYAKACHQCNLIAQAKIQQVLRDDQRDILQSLNIKTLTDIETGHEPFEMRLKDEIDQKRKRRDYQSVIRSFPETFCILPWIHTLIESGGRVRLCCFSSEDTAESGARMTLNIQQQSLGEIWNSPEMSEVRRKMLAGEKVAACSRCDRTVAAGQISGREFYNKLWLEEDVEREKWLARVRESSHDIDGPVPLPVYYDLLPGNLCNLRCRMCNADYSSAVRNDPAHSHWVRRSPDIEETRFGNGMSWLDEQSPFMDELLENIQDTRTFYLSGGEPLINPFVERLVDTLIERGVSKKIDLQFSTNLTVFPEELFKKLAEFKSVRFHLSIDGLGPIYEYIRFPAKWEDVKRNLESILGYSDFSVAITPTIQNYNVLSIVGLLEYAESLNLPCTLNILYAPHYLSVRAMPGKARILAITRLLEYLDKSSLVKKFPDMAISINEVIMELKENTRAPYPDTIFEFMAFTDTLDKSRKQSFKDTCPEFYTSIIEDGFTWITEEQYPFLKERIPSLLSLEKIGNGESIQWGNLISKLKPSRSKKASLRKALNMGKDLFTEICLHPANAKRQSPVEYAAHLQLKTAAGDGKDFKKLFTAYLSQNEDPVSGAPYLEACEKIDRSMREKIHSLLSRKEQTAFDDLVPGSLLYVDTGYDPLGDRIAEQIKFLRISRIAGTNARKYKDFFCPMPFEYITVCDNGDVYLCSACKMRTGVGNLSRESFEDIWNSDSAVEVRKAILNGSYKYCNENECEYLQDHKLKRTKQFNGPFYKNIIAGQVTRLDEGPRTIEVSYDKSCNLSCHYCRQETVMCKGDDLRRLRKIHDKVLKSGMRGVSRLMISGCGDPLSSRLHRDFLRNLDRKLFPDIRIKLQTNGLLLTTKMWESLSSSHYAIDWISISIDAATEETYKINRGGSFKKLLKNLEFVSTLRKDKKIDAFNINFVVQANNFREMKQFIELGKRLGCDYINFQKIMNLGIDYGLYSEEEYQKVAVHLPSHPDHKEFLQVLDDPVFLDPRIGLFKLLEFFPEDTKKEKDVDSIIMFYPEAERHLGEI